MKKILLTALSLVTVAVVAVVGTVAYLTWDDSDVNVMTMGNVSIAQHEYQRVVNEDGSFATETIDNRNSYVLEVFEQGKPILPSAIDTSTWEGWGYDSTTVRMSQVDSYGGMQVFYAASNAQDKFVTVENTGKTDAYIRTLVAIECGDGDANLVGSSFHFTWTNNRIGIIEIDGNKYYLTEYVYKGGQLSDGSWRHGKGILPAGDTSYPSLSQVYLHSRATNEDCEALDGNDNGTLDILVFSQAVQADGFADATTALDAAFGDITTTNHPWVGEGNAPVIPTVVSTADELQVAIESAKDGEDAYIILANDINTDGSNIGRTNFGTSAEAVFNVNAGNVTIDFNGKNIVSNTTGGNNVFSIFMVTGNASLTVVGEGKLTYDTYGRPGGSAAFTCFGANSVINLNGDIEVEIVGAGSSMQMIYAHGATADLGKIYVNAGTYIGKTTTSFTNPFYAQGGGNNSIIVSGGEFKVYSNYEESKMTAIDKYMTITDGYTYVASEKDTNGFIVYTVIAE